MMSLSGEGRRSRAARPTSRFALDLGGLLALGVISAGWPCWWLARARPLEKLQSISAAQA